MKVVKIGTLTDRKIGYGIVQPGASVPNGVPVIKVNNIISGLRNRNELETTSFENDAKYKRTKLLGGELIISVVGTIGKTAIVPKSFAGCNLVRATCLIDIKDEMLTYWVKYYIDSPQGQRYIHENLNTTVQPTLNVKSLVEMPIPMFNEKYRKKAISILKSLDDKIEVNRRINENLEQQAQALFKSWFVDFEPFRDGEFVESELGMIPKGWRVELFKDVCDNITDGVHNSVKDDINGNFYLLSCKNIKGGVITIGENERKVNKETFDKLRKRTRLQKGDLLLSSVGTIGEMVLLNEVPSNYEFQRSVAIIKPNKEIISSHFLYYAMKTQKDEIIHSAHGAVQQCLFISDVANFKTIVPSRKELLNFTNIAVGLHDKISENIKESRRLAELRDTLLPKLMSGELKVNDMNI